MLLGVGGLRLQTLSCRGLTSSGVRGEDMSKGHRPPSPQLSQQRAVCQLAQGTEPLEGARAKDHQLPSWEVLPRPAPCPFSVLADFLWCVPEEGREAAVCSPGCPLSKALSRISLSGPPASRCPRGAGRQGSVWEAPGYKCSYVSLLPSTPRPPHAWLAQEGP